MAAHNNVILKLFRILSAIFDSAFIYFIFFLLLIFPLNSIVGEYQISGTISLTNILILVLFIFLGLILSCAYYFLFALVFKGSSIGMKIFYLKLVRDDNLEAKKRQLLLRFSFMLIIFIFTLGLSLISDIISIVLTNDGRTFCDQLVNLKMVKNMRKE